MHLSQTHWSLGFSHVRLCESIFFTFVSSPPFRWCQTIWQSFFVHPADALFFFLLTLWRPTRLVTDERIAFCATTICAHSNRNLFTYFNCKMAANENHCRHFFLRFVCVWLVHSVCTLMCNYDEHETRKTRIERREEEWRRREKKTFRKHILFVFRALCVFCLITQQYLFHFFLFLSLSLWVRSWENTILPSKSFCVRAVAQLCVCIGVSVDGEMTKKVFPTRSVRFKWPYLHSCRWPAGRVQQHTRLNEVVDAYISSSILIEPFQFKTLHHPMTIDSTVLPRNGSPESFTSDTISHFHNQQCSSVGLFRNMRMV